MKKKEKYIISAVMILILCISVVLPQIIISTVPDTEVILPIKRTYTPNVVCSGIIQDEGVREVYALAPLMISDIKVRKGDWVNKGDILAVVDTQTSQVLQASNPISAQLASSTQMESYKELAQKYGMEDQLEEYLSQKNSPSLQAEVQPVEEYITAKQSGIITALNMHKGQLCEAGEQIYSISDQQGYSAVLGVAEEDISEVNIGNRVILSAPALGDDTIQAVVTAISPVVTQTISGLEIKSVVEVQADLLQNYPMVKENMTISAKIATGESRSLLSIPYEAVSQDEQNREYVLQMIDGKAERCYIECKNERTDYLEIADHLDSNAAIVLGAEEYHGKERFKVIYRENWYD